ncbi:hypothetical protein M8J76_012050 [Diaphorina citri]|nr:hypothetical protein M8J76_012050 [Diaphorina citri]
MAKRKGSTKAAKATKKPKNDVDENNGEEEEYEVEKIIHHRKFSNGSVEYLIRWKGYGADDDTWEKEANLASSAQLIKEYKEMIRDEEGSDNDVTNGNEEECPASEEENGDDFKPNKKAKTKKAKKTTGRGRPKKKAGRGRPKGSAKSTAAVKKNNRSAQESEDEDGEETTEEFEVEKIMDVHTSKNGKKEYLVRWKGYSSKDDTWEPEDHLTCPDLIEAFNVKLEKIKSVSVKSLRAAPAKTNRLIIQNQRPGGRHSKRNYGNRKSYAENDD